MSISMVDVAVMSIVGVIAGVFSDVEIRVGVSVGDAKPGADEVFVACRVDVWVGPPEGTCVAVGVFVLAGTGVSDGGGTGVEVGGGAVTVKDPFDGGSTRIEFPLGSEAAALPIDRDEVPGLALVLTSKMIFATEPLGIAAWSRPKMITRTVPAAGREYLRNLPTDAGEEPMVTQLGVCSGGHTYKRLLSKVRSKFNPDT
jgi:hypothetical protein